MKLIFMGTPTFAIPSLKSLINGPDEISAVITQPDRKRGRGQKEYPSPIKAAAESANIPVYAFSTLKEKAAIDCIKKLNPDLIVVVAFGQIIPDEILTLPKHGCINAHASLLPQYRGAAPIQRAIMYGKQETGITIIRLVSKLDSGPMLWRKNISIGTNEPFGSLNERLSQLAGEGIITACDLIRSDYTKPILQEEEHATYAKKIEQEDELIAWDKDATTIHNQIRALDPVPGAYTLLNGKRLKVFGSSIISESSCGIPGEINEITDSGVIVQTGMGRILIQEVQPENKSKMRFVDFSRGARLTTGERLG